MTALDIPQWPVGFFGRGFDLRQGRSFEDLDLTPEERKVLTRMQECHDRFLREEHRGRTREICLAQLRGMKFAFDAMRTSVDACGESIMWQARFY